MQSLPIPAAVEKGITMENKHTCHMKSEQRLDLIDRAKVYELACVGCTRHGELPGECYHDEPCEKLIFAFTVAEPVDAVEVVHGQWIPAGKTEELAKCSVCGTMNHTLDYVFLLKMKYCPYCGAKMDGGNEDG